MNLESEFLARDILETNPIAIKPETAGHVKEKSPGLPHPTAILLGSLPNQFSCFVSMCEPTLGPWQGFPFLQR